MSSVSDTGISDRMSPTLEFLERLLRHGEAVMRERPAFAADERPGVMRLLEAIHAEARLEVAGPPPAFDPDVALAGASFLAGVCWALVSGDASAPEMPPDPTSPVAHFSGDLCLRYLPTVYRRVRTRATDDPLHRAVADALRRWPLAGAGSDVPDPPLGPTDFGGHHGLQLLYAERLAANPRPGWVPREGRTREAVELVLHQLGRALPPEMEVEHRGTAG
jgi:hypothetical protein